ncbi:cobalamin biosynthesis protein [Sphingobium estronivorans]|uniref:cobalamin biosynthesis protein n=1 Tax=Sphingobium estronivorans TaxID=1577690 RepID=UPI001239ECE5|nr:cobalamin biosynthesis protein [Sphingobium estronivorans]
MIVAGFGFRKSASLVSLRSAWERATEGANAPAALATLDHKAPQLASLARELRLPLIKVSSDRLAIQSTRTHSPASLAAHRTGSVAEAAALAAAGPHARLLAPRAVSQDRLATCALAEGNPA